MSDVHEHPGKRSECEICMKDPNIVRLVDLMKELEREEQWREERIASWGEHD